MKSRMNKNIVAIGGGTGTFAVLSGLKKYPVNLSAIVSMADDGGSSGLLRDEFGVLPPGDIRRSLVALSDSDKLVCDLFNYRFEEGSLKDHSFGNILILALERMFGSFEKAIDEAGKILGARGQVIPVTLDKARLQAHLENGKIIFGETNIDIPKHDGELKIEKVCLSSSCKANKRALLAIKNADLIVIGPGDIYTSIIPNFLVTGISSALKRSKANKVYICNLMTKNGETNNFSALDFVNTIESYLGRDILDYVFLNKGKASPQHLVKYKKAKADLVGYKRKDFENKNYRIIERNLIRPSVFIRHDSNKLAKTIISLA